VKSIQWKKGKEEEMIKEQVKKRMDIVLSTVEKIIQILNEEIYQGSNQYAYDTYKLTSRKQLM